MVNMDIISELKEYIGNNPLFYLKFCRCLEYANDILNGNLYSNNVKYFRELEEKEHEHGQGDLHEVALLAKSENITLYDNNTNELIAYSPTGFLEVKFNDDLLRPIVCFVGVTLDDLKVKTYNEHFAEFEFAFSYEDYNLFSKKFGEYCVIISGKELIDKIKEYCANIKTDFVFGKVTYSIQNDIDRVNAFMNGTKYRFLYKDPEFSYQREYRFATKLEMPSDHFFRIGPLADAKIVQTSALSNLCLRINYTLEEKD